MNIIHSWKHFKICNGLLACQRAKILQYTIRLDEDGVLKSGRDSNLGELQRVTVDRGRTPNCQFPCKRKLIYFGLFSSFNFVQKRN